MNTQKLEQVPIDKLVPYARNARTHSKEQIAQLRASLREFGFVSPAVIDADYNILVGHGRITAAREEGYETVPCVFAENLTEAQKRAYILADNQLALNAGWDEEMLSVELSDLQDQSFDLSLLGFDAGELDKQAFVTMMNKLVYAHRIILKPYVDALKNTSSDDSLRRIQEIQTLLAQNTEKRETLTKLMTQGIIDPILFNKETNELLSQADSFRDEINALKNAVSGDVTKPSRP